ncbi:MAG TPA: beta-ketoacyl-ACP synthase III [Bdellovibrionota bacterium]|jgi:3-oxoacyl-[acyl-carrier-protein] synthase-3|nr:beta-ketoacyl-ACP synthase III [Bdellovibrionota bacterium]
MKNLRSRIRAVDYYVPPKVWSNDDLKELMDTSDEWIQQRTGIKQRHWCDQDTGTSDLAVHACQGALKKAGMDKSEIDMIILGTLSPDHEFPGTACFLQAKMGMPGVPALDIRQQCTGFIYGLSIADQFIRSGMYKNIMVVGAEVHSKGLDRSTAGREVSVLFGDGAGCAIVSAADVGDAKKDAHILSTHLYADGSFAKELWIPAGGSALGTYSRLEPAMLEKGLHWPHMNGKTVFMHAVKRMPEACAAAFKANGVKPSDVDLYVFHQANLRINEMVAKILEVPAEKVFNTIDRFGNTTAATIPIGLAEAEAAGKLKPGMLVMSAAFGSGFTWASTLIRW